MIVGVSYGLTIGPLLHMIMIATYCVWHCAPFYINYRTSACVLPTRRVLPFFLAAQRMCRLLLASISNSELELNLNVASVRVLPLCRLLGSANALIHMMYPFSWQHMYVYRVLSPAYYLLIIYYTGHITVPVGTPLLKSDALSCAFSFLLSIKY